MLEEINRTSSSVKPNSLLKVDDVAAILNISRSAAYNLLQTRQLISVRMGKSVRVRPVDLEAFIQANLTRPIDSSGWKF